MVSSSGEESTATPAVWLGASAASWPAFGVVAGWLPPAGCSLATFMVASQRWAGVEVDFPWEVSTDLVCPNFMGRKEMAPLSGCELSK